MLGGFGIGVRNLPSGGEEGVGVPAETVKTRPCRTDTLREDSARLLLRVEVLPTRNLHSREIGRDPGEDTSKILRSPPQREVSGKSIKSEEENKIKYFGLRWNLDTFTKRKEKTTKPRKRMSWPQVQRFESSNLTTPSVTLPVRVNFFFNFTNEGRRLSTVTRNQLKKLNSKYPLRILDGNTVPLGRNLACRDDGHRPVCL